MIFYFHPENWGNNPILTSIFFNWGWFNHQRVVSAVFFAGRIETSFMVLGASSLASLVLLATEANLWGGCFLLPRTGCLGYRYSLGMKYPVIRGIFTQL